MNSLKYWYGERGSVISSGIVYTGPENVVSGGVYCFFDQQCFMQDQNVACHDLGKVSFERAVGCFGKPQLEHATRFPMPQLERATRFPMSQLERATRFPNVPSRARDSLLNCQFKVCVFDCFCHSMPFNCLNITSINYITR